MTSVLAVLLCISYAVAQSVIQSLSSSDSCVRRSIIIYTSDSSTYVVTDLGSTSLGSFPGCPSGSVTTSTVYGTNYTITTSYSPSTITVFQSSGLISQPTAITTPQELSWSLQPATVTRFETSSGFCPNKTVTTFTVHGTSYTVITSYPPSTIARCQSPPLISQPATLKIHQGSSWSLPPSTVTKIETSILPQITVYQGGPLNISTATVIISRVETSLLPPVTVYQGVSWSPPAATITISRVETSIPPPVTIYQEVFPTLSPSTVYITRTLEPNNVTLAAVAQTPSLPTAYVTRTIQPYNVTLPAIVSTIIQTSYVSVTMSRVETSVLLPVTSTLKQQITSLRPQATATITQQIIVANSGFENGTANPFNTSASGAGQEVTAQVVQSGPIQAKSGSSFL